jgi:voltage-gated potassium channel
MARDRYRPTGKVLRVVLLLMGLILAGTFGFVRLEGLTILDAVYLTAETLSTVGYGNISPLTPEGKVFSVVLMLGGASVALAAAGLLVAYIVEGRLAGFFGKRREMRQIEKMKDHVVLCGFGQMGRRVAQMLQQSSIPCLVVEGDDERAEEARSAGFLVVDGDATEEGIMKRVGLDRARGLITCIGDDAENLYIGMTARAQRPELPVICRVTATRAEANLRRAGITQVVSAVEMGARRMVQTLLRPEVVDFMDLSLGPGGRGTGMESYGIPEGSPLENQTLRDTKLRERFGLHVIAIRREGEYLPTPSPAEVLRGGDVLLLVGTEETFDQFRSDAGLSGG